MPKNPARCSAGKENALKRWKNKSATVGGNIVQSENISRPTVVNASDICETVQSETVIEPGPNVCDSEVRLSDSDSQYKPEMNVRQEKLKTRCSEIPFVDSEQCKYILIDVSKLSELVQNIVCADCQNKTLDIELSGDYDMAHKAEIRCNVCKDAVISSIYTSQRIKKESKRPAFDVNQRVAHAFSQIGKSHDALAQFAMIMNMSTVSEKTFHKHMQDMTASTHTVKTIFEGVRAEVRHVYSDLIVDKPVPNILDISVSYNGSWMTRGHTSAYGVQCVIDMLTGYVIDYIVKSKYCQQCTKKETTLGKNSQELTSWKETHAPDCDINHYGSSGSMEMDTAVELRQQSECYGFRYKTLLSDGDAKTFMKLNEVQPYGEGFTIVKEECVKCVNHVGKRLGTALHNAVLQWRSQGVTLGGKEYGTLKSTTIKKLTKYYQNAIIKNKGDTNAMKSAIYATLLHSISTDSKPQHNKCPPGKSSWCFYQQAMAKGTQPPPHAENVGTPLKEAYLSKIMPIYQRLATTALLERCVSGRTQNANESLHSMIWQKCPKEGFGSRRRVEIAVAQAVCDFNVGVTKTVTETQKAAGMSPGGKTVVLAILRDSHRISKAKQRATSKYQKACH
ncbi:hypothetical protein ANN_08711 [Periplaneta americana]|uniref:Mutator-like transposase domain-containing protein n=1 Tax=Periplaneta americana TaxID=6978 RepID=A0ABQ8T3J5_PERAM|nr:hypothetical protein ANN_08711 [Periplaneta americana]